MVHLHRCIRCACLSQSCFDREVEFTEVKSTCLKVSSDSPNGHDAQVCKLNQWKANRNEGSRSAGEENKTQNMQSCVLLYEELLVSVASDQHANSSGTGLLLHAFQPSLYSLQFCTTEEFKRA